MIFSPSAASATRSACTCSVLISKASTSPTATPSTKDGLPESCEISPEKLPGPCSTTGKSSPCESRPVMRMWPESTRYMPALLFPACMMRVPPGKWRGVPKRAMRAISSGVSTGNICARRASRVGETGWLILQAKFAGSSSARAPLPVRQCAAPSARHPRHPSSRRPDRLARAGCRAQLRCGRRSRGGAGSARTRGQGNFCDRQERRFEFSAPDLGVQRLLSERHENRRSRDRRRPGAELSRARRGALGRGAGKGGRNGQWVGEKHPRSLGAVASRRTGTTSVVLVCGRLEGTRTTLAIEPLNRKESNIINSVAEGVRFARQVNRPEIRVLADFYHIDEEREPLDTLKTNGEWLARNPDDFP